MECIFCRIIAGEVPADIVYQDSELLAFRDIHPQAPTHILIMPKGHIASLTELTRKEQALMGRLILLAKELAEKEGVAAKGYRLSVSCGADGGQLVPHVHFHLLGGRKLDDQLG
ncbi:MAG TPA: histidine triad nucleotide-binding protein [Dehalococcoidia bacterium]|nr:histidine triad nucleotide-binding protein [Dehalococcoidia bacterium]